MLVTARTHASIAGYSTNVPTLVVGYSVKSQGMAKDIFGDSENYVCQVRDLKKKDDLLRKFLYVFEHHDEIKDQLIRVMPSYKKSAIDFGKVI